MQSTQNLIGEHRHRLRQDRQRFAVDLVAPATALHQMPEREQEAAAPGIGENALQGAVARLPLLLEPPGADHRGRYPEPP